VEASTAQFLEVARALGAVARRRRLVAPGFRSPPRLKGVARSLRRWPDGSSQVAVQVRGRPMAAVTADMIDGVVAANQLTGAEADRLRSELWAAVSANTGPSLAPRARVA
jgi:hypothetical protein